MNGTDLGRCRPPQPRSRRSGLCDWATGGVGVRESSTHRTRSGPGPASLHSQKLGRDPAGPGRRAQHSIPGYCQRECAVRGLKGEAVQPRHVQTRQTSTPE